MHEKKEETYIVKNKESDFMKGILKTVISVLLLLCLAFSIVGCKGEETGIEGKEIFGKRVILGRNCEIEWQAFDLR